MIFVLLSILFVSLFYTFSLISEERILIELKDDEQRGSYTLLSNKNYQIINSCNDKIFLSKAKVILISMIVILNL